MIDTENAGCDTCTAPGAPVLDASTPQSRAWPRVDIETNPYNCLLYTSDAADE